MRSISADGREWITTSVRIPKPLHDMAVENQISMSATLTNALEQECGGEKSFPGGQSPTAPPITPRGGKRH
jgi:hypothetical protein